MTPKPFRGVVRCAVALVASLGMAAAAGAQQATTTGAIRGVITGPEGAPQSGVTVVATNDETGVRRGAVTDPEGRYQIPFLTPGPYTVRAQMIGFRAVERPALQIGIGTVERLDFRLETAPVQLEAQRIVADVDALIEPTKTGTSTRISELQINELPTNGRNFKDLVVLAPGTSDQGNLGSGGGQSIGGGRTGASNILMDGVNNNESFFGGDARGGDRAPFSYSIEAVKEIQVITAGYDVERGNFTGGTVNAVTKSGTNRYQGAVFGYLRQDEAFGLRLTGDDYFGRPPVDFKSQQYGFALGGPILKDRAHFFVALDKQTRNEPRPVFPDARTDAEVRAAGIHPDTVAKIVRIARDRYGYDASGELGQFAQNTDEDAFFGRVDWQINSTHTLTLRDNYTNTNLSRDRLVISPASTDFVSNGGDNTDESNSFVASLTSAFASGVSNEFRAQYATEYKPRPSYPSGGYAVPLPQVILRGVGSTLSTGDAISSEVRFGADPVLHSNLLDQRTVEVIDNVRWALGAHTFKVGGTYLNVDVLNRFWNNSLGTFTFNSLADFENGTPSRFQRTQAQGGATLPVAEYQVNEVAVYAQDEWQVSPRLFVTYGLRYDYTWYPADVDPNPALERTFPYLDVTKQPTDNDNISPRFGFTYDPSGDGRQVVRGGTGVFYGRSPYVLWSNALLNTGAGQTSLDCTAAGTVPVPDFARYAQDLSTIPTACLGAAAAAPAPQINVFDSDYRQSYAWKTNLAYDRLLAREWRVTLEGVYSTVRDNYLVQDDNLNPVPWFFIEGELPVFMRPEDITAATAAMSTANNRRDQAFNQVYVHRSLGSTLSYQGIVQLRGRARGTDVYASYTYDNTRDNASIPCCITGSMFEQGRVSGNPNNYDNQWGRANFSRKHTLVLSPTVTLPYGVQLGAIFRAFSGLPWTARYGGDINGDGVANDRLYVPTAAEVADYQFFVPAGTVDTAAALAEQAGLLESKIRRIDCLRENRGRVVPRNSCENPATYVLDARVSKRVTTVRGQSIELVADFFNVLNGLNDEWGRRMEVDTERTSGNDRFLVPRRFANNKFVYEVNRAAGTVTPATVFSTSQFQMQLGLRYNF